MELSERDALCLDGDRLVAEPGSTHGSPGARYRPSSDALRRVYELPRDADLNGPAGFRVDLPDGRHRTYGSTVESRVEVPLEEGRVAETWLLDREVDRAGNAISYHYEHITPTGHGLEDEFRVGDLVRISSIRYTHFGSEEGNRRVEFQYSSIARRPNVGSLLPPDGGAASGGGLVEAAPPEDGFRHGVLWWPASVFPLQAIRTFGPLGLVHEYRFRGADDQTTHRYRVREIQLCANAPAASARDLDASGLVCLPSTRFDWRDTPLTGDTDQDSRYGLPTFQRWDVDVSRYARPLPISCGQAPDGSTRRCSFSNPFAVLDVNGDGADDIFHRQPDVGDDHNYAIAWGRPGRRSTRSLAAPEVPFSRVTHPRVRGLPADRRLQLVNLQRGEMKSIDWNLDGRDDIVALLLDADATDWVYDLVVLVSDGEDFDLVQTGTRIRAGTVDGSNTFAVGMEFADVNGDGRKDLLVCEHDFPFRRVPFGRFPRDFDGWRGHWSVALRTDDGFEELANTGVSTVCDYEYGGDYVSNFNFEWSIQTVPSYPRRPAVGDFDGDGTEELLIAEPYDSFDNRAARILTWDGPAATFTGLGEIETDIPAGNWTVLDTNGDGNHDVVLAHYSDQNSANRGCPLFTDINATCPDRRISSGVLGNFIFAGTSHDLPGRAPARAQFTGANATNRLRIPLPLIGFDLNGDGRGDLLARTLPRGGNVIICDDSEPGRRCDFPFNSGWWLWRDEDVWTLDSLTSSTHVSYATSATIDGLRRYDGNGSHDYWRADVIPLDGDGDGALDLVQFIDRDEAHAPLRQPPLAFFHNVRAQAALIERVTNGLGAQVEVEYANLSDREVYTPSTDCQYPQRCVTDSRTVVRTIRRDDGIDGTNDTTYEYEDGRVDLRGGGWVGFARVHAENLASGVHVETFYDNRTVDRETGLYPFAHAPTLTRTWRKARVSVGPSVANEGHYQHVERVVAHPLPGVMQVRTTASTEAHFETMSESLETIGPSSPIVPVRRTRIARTQFDDLGFARRETVDDGVAIQTVRTKWAHELGEWLIGRATRRETTVSTGDSACDRESAVEYEYDWDLGRPSRVISNPDDAALRTSTRYSYEGSYRQISRILVESSEEPRETVIEWSGDGYFPAGVTNALGHQTNFAFESGHGVAYETVSALGIHATRAFDGFGRPRAVSGEGSITTTTEYRRTERPDLAYEVVTHNDVGGRSIEFLDRLGRPVARESLVGSTWTRTALGYDRRGRIEWVVEPHEGPESDGGTTIFQYDDLDRRRRVQPPNGGYVEMWYEPHKTFTRNELGHVWTRAQDARGLLERVTVPEGIRGGGSYTYCGAGELRTVSDDLGNTTEIEYDRLGRRTILRDPDAGVSRFEYDALGQLRRTVDAEQREVRFDYDALGRPLFRWREAEGIVDEWHWDTARTDEGRMAPGLLHFSVSGDGVRDEVEYDRYGRVRASTRTVESTALTTITDYDEYGRPKWVQYPTLSGAQPVSVEYHYGSSGQLTSMRSGDGETYWELIEQTPRGQPRVERMGPIERQTSYGVVGEIEHIKSFAGSRSLQDITYEYDRRGILERRVDGIAGRENRFVHDPLGRITAVLENGWFAEKYTYDDAGNLIYAHDATLSYERHGGIRPHAARAVSYADGATENIEYNAAGEALRIGRLELEYTQLGLPRAASNGSATVEFLYDAGGSRASRRNKVGKTLYAGAWEREEYGFFAIERVAIATPAGVVAQAEIVSEGGSTKARTRWLLTERQGSVETSWVEGEDPEHHRYDAFGGVLDAERRVTGNSPSDVVRSGYTGHEHDAELGVINMRGRWYHPRLRRFLSADPLSGGDGQRQNRYSYVRNSPFVLTDPSGWNEDHEHDFESRIDPDDMVGRFESDEAVLYVLAPTVVGNDSAESETSGAGAAGAAPASASMAAGSAGPPDGAPLHIPSGYGEPPGRDAQEVMAAVRGFGLGLLDTAAGLATGLAVAGALGAVAVFAPIVATAAVAYMGYQTLTGLDDAYDGFLERFEKASIPNAPLEYHEEAGRALGGLVGTVWAGPLIEAGFALAGPAARVLSTATAESIGTGAISGGGSTTFLHGAPAAAAEDIVANGLREVSVNTGLYPRGSFFTHAASEPLGHVAASHWPVTRGTRSTNVQVVALDVPNAVLSFLRSKGLVRTGPVPGVVGFPMETVFLPDALPILNQHAARRLLPPVF